jgi:phage-related protein
MTRLVRASGEKPLFWVGSSQEDLQQFPEPVKDALGIALNVAQFCGKHPAAKPWKGEGPGVLEVVEDYRGGTYRAVYTVKFAEAIYVLHVFQKKSPSGIRTSQKDARLILRRLHAARVEYEARHAKEQR